MSNLPLLSLLIWLPIIGGGLVLALGNQRANAARWISLLIAFVVFLLSIPLLTGFDYANAGLQFIERREWITAYDIQYHVGADGISVALVLLTTITSVLVLIGAWGSVGKRVSQYFATLLILEGVMIGVFCAVDAILFYAFFEGMLIPMFIIIGVWGGPRRVYAAMKFFLYTFLGSVFMLVGLIYLYMKGGSWQIPDLVQLPLTATEQMWLFFAFFLGFAVKIPMFPVHTWLPDAHVEAPTGGSVVLAAIMLKIGGYGFLRFSLPIVPDASHEFAMLMIALSLLAIVYVGMVALVQDDMKKLIAYSSVAHMGFVTAGTFTLTQQGLEGAIYQMLSHGIVSAALFLCVGVVYDRIHSREIARYGGLVHRMPRYAFMFMVFMLASVGMPGTSGFIGEFLVMVGAFQANTWLAFLIATGLILGAAYMLWLYRRVIFGALTKPDLMDILDLNRREVAIFVPLAVIVMWMGIYPSSFLEIMSPSVTNLIENYELARAQSEAPVLAALGDAVLTWAGGE